MKFSIFFDHLKEINEKENVKYSELFNFLKNHGINAVDIDYKLVLNKNDLVDKILLSSIKISSAFFMINGRLESDRSQIKELIFWANKMKVTKILLLFPDLSIEEANWLNINKDNKVKIWDYFNNNIIIQNIIEVLQYAVNEGKKKDVQIMIENYDSIKSVFAYSNEIDYFLNKVQGLFLCLDTGNSILFDENITNFIDAYSNKIIHVHLKNRKKDKNDNLKICSIGNGIINVQLVIDALEKLTYSGFYSIEHYDVSNQTLAVKESVKFCNKLNK